jgi:hypothetical protein
MRRSAALALAAVALVGLAFAGCGGDDSGTRKSPAAAGTGTYVGTVTGSDAYVAIVIGRGGAALAHVTDGAYSVDWLDGARAGNSARLSNEGGATIDARFAGSTVTGTFQRPREPALTFTARRGEAPAGLYRAVEDFADGRYVGGWVVLPDGSERATVRRYETPLTPGEVDATTFEPGDTTFTAPGGVLRPELVRPSGDLSLPN